MKKIAIALLTVLAASSAFATTGTADLEQKNGQTALYISGPAAEVLFSRIEMEPGYNPGKGLVKGGQHIVCYSNGDETTCKINVQSLNDGNLSGAVDNVSKN